MLGEVVRRLDAAGVSARRLQLREPSLDDVFLELTGHAAEEQDGTGDRPDQDGAAADRSGRDGAAGGRERTREATR